MQPTKSTVWLCVSQQGAHWRCPTSSPNIPVVSCSVDQTRHKKTSVRLWFPRTRQHSLASPRQRAKHQVPRMRTLPSGVCDCASASLHVAYGPFMCRLKSIDVDNQCAGFNFPEVAIFSNDSLISDAAGSGSNTSCGTVRHSVALTVTRRPRDQRNWPKEAEGGWLASSLWTYNIRTLVNKQLLHCEFCSNETRAGLVKPEHSPPWCSCKTSLQQPFVLFIDLFRYERNSEDERFSHRAETPWLVRIPLTWTTPSNLEGNKLADNPG